MVLDALSGGRGIAERDRFRLLLSYWNGKAIGEDKHRSISCFWAGMAFVAAMGVVLNLATKRREPPKKE